jgi:hypothetical protein
VQRRLFDNLSGYANLEDGMRGSSTSECGYRTSLDAESLVCARDRAYPLARLAECMRCPESV